ncbi:IS3 family transposase [Virgisporangium aurantiacum]|nr:IS3 family transposase [Virgisporangium aurantiacum]
MAAQGWQGAFLRRGWRGGSTKQNPAPTPAPDRVNRNFTAVAPNRLWVADATRIPCGEGVFWLALMENFFSTLKIELVYRRTWRTRDEAENAIFAYIDGWYNTRRIEHELGYLSPTSTKPPGISPRQLSSSLSQPAAGSNHSAKAGGPHP